MRTIAYWLALGLVFLIPFEKLLTFGSKSGPTLVHYFGLFVAGFWLLTVVATDKFRKLQPFHILVALFILWNAASIFWSISLSFSTNRFETYVQLGGLVLVLWDLFTTPNSVQRVLQAYVLGGWISVGATIFNFLQGITAHDYIVRYSAGGFNENELSLVLALGMPMAWYLATVAPASGCLSTPLRFLNYLYMPGALFAVLLTASRGGLLCTLPAFAYVLATFTRPRLYQRVLLFVALVGAIYFVSTHVPESSYERLSQTSDGIEAGDLNGRIEVWRLGLLVFFERPLTGVGTGAFEAATELGRAAHNAFLSVLVEVGLIGLVLFLAIIAVSIQHAVRHPSWLAWLWLTIILTWILGVMPLSLEYRKPTWLILSLPVMASHAFAAWRPAVRTAPSWTGPRRPAALSPEAQ